MHPHVDGVMSARPKAIHTKRRVTHLRSTSRRRLDGAIRHHACIAVGG
jgi:hypothetical protein